MTVARHVSSPEQPLSELVGQCQRLLSALEIGFAVLETTTDPDGAPADFTVVSANIIFEALSLLSAGQAGHRPASDHLPPDELRRWIALLTSVKTGGPPLRFESRSLRGDKRYRGFVCSLVPRLLAVAVEDVTERRRAEHDYADLESQLIQAQKMEVVGQLAGGIAHDFNNILTAIIMRLNVLRAQPAVSPKVLVRALDDLLDSANLAAGVTRQLLLIGRGQPMQMARHDLNQLVATLKVLLAHMLEERIEVTVRLADEPLWVDGDASMIEQVVMNLCINARDAMPSGGHLVIATSAERSKGVSAHRLDSAGPGPYACLAVSDTGEGIAPDLLGRVFDPFFTTKPQDKGTGLGLAIVRSVTAKHGGFVTVRSKPGRGSTFTVYFPLASTSDAPAASSPPEKPRGGSERILVVEDNELLREVAVESLRGLGYAVTEAADGDAALREWTEQSGRFDLLFTDIVMPGGLSGLNLCTRLQRERPDLKAIITSGHSTEFVRCGDLPVPRFVYLAKPYDLETLAGAVRRCLDKG